MAHHAVRRTEIHRFLTIRWPLSGDFSGGSAVTVYVQWNPLNTKLKGLMKSVHVIRISCYQNK